MTSSNSSDALLFYAISYECRHKGVANLVGIIAAEDAINRSVPTLEELNTGLARLLLAGLVERETDGFRVTNAGTKFGETAEAGGGTVFTRLENLAHQIGTLDSVVDFTAEVKENDYQEAYDAYYGAV